MFVDPAEDLGFQIRVEHKLQICAFLPITFSFLLVIILPSLFCPLPSPFPQKIT